MKEFAALASWTRRLVALDGVEGSVLVGCSGGPDSLALLSLARASGFDAVAVYVDHGLRRGTDHDYEIVATAAERLGARSERVAVAVEPGPNLEARARQARYEALESVRRRNQCAATLVGHTLDDQAETILLQFLRGSGAAGLSGMPMVREPIRRPLLALRRRDTHEICARLGFAPVADPMNLDPRHRRVWLRRELIPFLEAGARRDIVPVIARQGDVMRDDDALLDALATDAAEITSSSLAVGDVARLPLPLARRVVRRWLGPPPPSLAQVEAVLRVFSGEHRAATLPGNRRVERVSGRVHLVPASSPLEPVTLTLPGDAHFGGFRLDGWIEAGAPVSWPDGLTTAVLDADRVGRSVAVRAPVAGERFRPAGSGGSKLVNDALAEAGVPASARPNRPVLADGIGDVVWVVGYRVDERFRVTSRTRRYLWVTSEAE